MLLSLFALAIAGVDVTSVLSTMLIAVLTVFGGWIATNLLPKIPALTQHLFDWINAQAGHVHNQYVAGALQRLSTLVGQKVLAYENTEIQALKVQLANGTLNKAFFPEYLNQVKQRLMAEVKQEATAQNLWATLLAVFAGNEATLTSALSSLVETHVATLPPSGIQTATNSGVSPVMSTAPVLPSNPQ